MPIRFNAPPSIGRATHKYGTWRYPSPARQLSGQFGEGILDGGDDLARLRCGEPRELVAKQALVAERLLKKMWILLCKFMNSQDHSEKP